MQDVRCAKGRREGLRCEKIGYAYARCADVGCADVGCADVRCANANGKM